MKESNTQKNYFRRYTGILRVFKQVQAALLLRSPQNQFALEEASSYADSEGIYRIVKYIENVAQDMKIQNFRYLKEAGNRQFASFQAQADKLEKDIVMYKNQQNKLSTGLCYIELGNLYLQKGDVTEAFRSYERVNNYYDTGDIYSYHLNWSACMLVEKRYDQLKTISPKEAVPLDRVKRQQHTTLFLFQALRCLYEGKTSEFLQVIKECVQHDSIVEDPTLLYVSNLREIGVVITMIILSRYSRNQALELLANESIRFLVTQDDNLIQILEAYISLDFNKLMKVVKPFLEEFEQDFLFMKFTFSEIIYDKITRLYLQPYKKIHVMKVISTIGMDSVSGLEYLKKMISNNSINFLYDPIDEVLVQKVTEKSKKYTTYENAVETITEFLRKKQHRMLQYQLSLVAQENYAKKLDQREKKESSSFSKLASAIPGFFKQASNQ